jgi:hypothetical protein
MNGEDTIKGFKREVTSADAAWWDLWHARKDDLRKAGFGIAKDDERWFLTYKPRRGLVLRDDPALEAKRVRAWDEHYAARLRTEEAIAAERAAFMRARRLYKPDEWLATLANDALAVLGEAAPAAEPNPEPLARSSDMQSATVH